MIIDRGKVLKLLKVSDTLLIVAMSMYVITLLFYIWAIVSQKMYIVNINDWEFIFPLIPFIIFLLNFFIFVFLFASFYKKGLSKIKKINFMIVSIVLVVFLNTSFTKFMVYISKGIYGSILSESEYITYISITQDLDNATFLIGYIIALFCIAMSIKITIRILEPKELGLERVD